MGKINIGAFTDKITFLKAINSKGEISQLNRQYVVLDSVFADVQVQPTSESIVEGNLIALEKIHVVTYSLPGVNTNCTFDGEVMIIMFLVSCMIRPGLSWNWTL